ncbi:class I SAM-dependent methyltransferase [Hyphococcus flavus]|uniref:Class I SAM-dependent methyltransferase n=1 Tax=Hyphococcus flavus TaxID=1866326 RepID=A0AAF0CF40_9PROT|nr:class I SAM-dependent methyltransferase [Hyphococcus flavus]WDI30433.1 class I SAM-dependent methyltransferase [Hyphococcus flavus]
MAAKDWNALADDFASRVLQITECDTDGVIEATAKRLGGAHKIATDFGCGAGAVTRLLAPHFKTVIGVDFSSKLVANAKSQPTAGNVSYEVVDISRCGKRFPCHVAFCVNVLIGNQGNIRERIARNVVASIEEGGHGVFVVPSLEAVMRVYQVGSALFPIAEVAGWVEDEVVSLPGGIINMGGVPTKHFLKDEIDEFLSRIGLCDVVVSRVPYPWRETIADAPRTLKAASPWDWIAVGRRADA